MEIIINIGFWSFLEKETITMRLYFSEFFFFFGKRYGYRVFIILFREPTYVNTENQIRSYMAYTVDPY